MNSCANFVLYTILGILVCTSKVIAQKIRGIPGVDYPNYPEIPKTSFKCSEQKYIPGFYADLETKCQVFHLCFKSRQESFLCPIGTTFNQEILACDSWYSSNCSLASLFYNVNSNPVIEKAGKGIPLILKLRNSFKDNVKVSTQASDVFDKISSLHEASTQHAIPSESKGISEKGNEESIKAEVEPKIITKNVVDSIVNVSYVPENSVSIEGTQSNERLNPEEAFKDAKDIGDDPEGFYSENMETELMYDPETQEYYMDDSSETDWEDESGINEYQNFYGDLEDLMQNGKTMHFQDNFVNQDMEEYTEIPAEDFDAMSEKDFSLEFSKRLSEIEQPPKRAKRKPLYVVLDEPDIRFPIKSKQNLNSASEPTESPHFVDSISIDDLIEFYTELPIESAQMQVDQTSDSLGVPDEPRNADGSETEFLGSENSFPEESQRRKQSKTLGASQLDLSNSSDGTKEDEAEESKVDPASPLVNDQSEQQNDEPGGVNGDDPSTYSRTAIDDGSEFNDQTYDGYLSSESVTEESDLDFDTKVDKDGQILPNLFEQNITPEELDQTLIIIPDSEESRHVLDENVEYEIGYPQAEDWSYAYSDMNGDSFSEGGNLPYEDVEKDMSNRITRDYESYANQGNYAYPDLPEGMDYSQFQNPEYNFMTGTEEGLGSDYRYLFDNRETQNFPADEAPDFSYGNVDGISDSEYSKYGLPENEFPEDNTYIKNLDPSTMSGSYYTYRQSAEQPVNFVNDYPYDSQYDYIYQDLDNIYTGEKDLESDLGSLDDFVDSVDTDAASLNSNEQTEADSLNSVEEDANVENFPLEVAEDGTDSHVDSNIDFPEDDESNWQNFEQNDGYYVFDFDEDASIEESDDFSNYDSDSNLPESEYRDVQSEKSEEFPEEELGKMKYEASDMKDLSQNAHNQLKTSTSSNESESHNKSAPQSLGTEFHDKGSLEDLVTDFKFERHTPSGKNSGHMIDELSVANKENEKPVTLSSALEILAGLQTTKAPVARKGFVTPSTTLLNDMGLQNSMNFDPYGFGNNMGQFSMIDSSKPLPFSKMDSTVPDFKGSPDQIRLAKLSSLKDKVLSMKRGKFGAFKKHVKNL